MVNRTFWCNNCSLLCLECESILTCSLGLRISSDSSGDNDEQGLPPTNEADLKDNKGEPKEVKLLKSLSSSEGNDKTKEEEKEVPPKTPGDEPGEGVSTKYRLRGVVVHSGQASGGHYYSFIRLR